jgi:hypothetical protein
VVIPIIVSGIFNVGILLSVRYSTRRIQTRRTITPSAVSTNPQNARDSRLLKHILFMLVVFIAGWAPVYILMAMSENDTDLGTAGLAFIILPELSILISVLDLLWYNHDVRKYLTAKLSNCLQMNRN